MSISRSAVFLSLFLLAGAALAQPPGSPSPLSDLEPPIPLEEVAAGANLPPLVPQPQHAERTFEENRGQYPAYIAYLWNGETLILEDGSSVVLLDAEPTSVEGRFEADFLRMELVGSRQARTEGRRPAAGHFNYLRGSESITGVSRYREVLFDEVYPGIDLVYRDRGGDGDLKYDFLVAAGVDPSVIRMRFQGAENVRLGEDGELIVAVPGREVVHQRPFAFESMDDSRREVEVAYLLLADGSVGFVVEGRNPDRALVIDPEILYSTYLGGSQTVDRTTCPSVGGELDSAQSIAVDGQSRAVIGGRTCAIDFPVENPFQSDLASVTFESHTDGFVTRFAPDGQTLEFSTYLGGADYDVVNAVAIGPGDFVTVAGSTVSEDFPLEDELFNELSMGTTAEDAFVTVFNASGDTLEFSTYLGGSDHERGLGVAIGPEGEIAVVGDTNSEDFPLEEPFQTYIDAEDAFVTVIAPDFSGLVFSTLLASAMDDSAEDVAIDLFGRVVVIGTTLSPALGPDLLPTVNALKAVNDNFLQDAFLASFESTGQPVFVTLLGGPETDDGLAVAVNNQGQIFATGTTGGDLFPEPSPDAFQPGFGGSSDSYVVKLDGAGQTVLYSTYFGGPNFEEARGIAVDAYGAAVIAGESSGGELPLASPIQDTPAGLRDAFVAKLTTEADALLFSTYLGGTSEEVGTDVAVDHEGSTYLTGFTFSDDYPVRDPYQGELLGEIDAVVTKLGESLVDFRYEYATKVVCGEQPEAEELVLARGAYATTVNVHSPGRERSRFRKKLALSIPPGFQQPGPIVPLSFDSLDYDEALASDCEDLRQRLAAADPNDESGAQAADFFEGFLVLQSTHPLDVTAVYSSAALDASRLAGDNASIDVEEVSERDRIEPTDLAITKQAFRLPSIFAADEWEYFFVGYWVTVTNLGDSEAYDLVVKDFLAWDGAFVVVPVEDTFVAGNGGTLTLDQWTPIPWSSGTFELTGEIPSLGAGETTGIGFWTIGARHLSQAPSTVVNTVFLTSAGDDPNPVNNTDVEVTDL
ncbi:MAG: hypothetical protein AAF604_06045 [Acidobacteriota bacterium]